MWNNYKIAVITLSDKGSRGEREDTSGKYLKLLFEGLRCKEVYYEILPDDFESIVKKLKNFSDEKKCELIITTGGTGFSVRDITPEATKQVITREVPGIAEAIRSYSMTITKRAMLSRGVSGIRNQTLIVNLPGSKKAVEECITYIIDELEHGIGILTGKENECGRK